MEEMEAILGRMVERQNQAAIGRGELLLDQREKITEEAKFKHYLITERGTKVKLMEGENWFDMLHGVFHEPIDTQKDEIRRDSGETRICFDVDTESSVCSVKNMSTINKLFLTKKKKKDNSKTKDDDDDDDDDENSCCDADASMDDEEEEDDDDANEDKKVKFSSSSSTTCTLGSSPVALPRTQMRVLNPGDRIRIFFPNGKQLMIVDEAHLTYAMIEEEDEDE